MQPEQILASPIIPFVMVFGVFYFLVFRPQRQREREHQNLLKALKKNDEVVTAAGIHGTIVNVKDTTVILRIDDTVKMEIEKSSVAAVKTQQAAAQTK